MAAKESTDKNTVVFSFRINDNVYNTVKQIADREKRSINKQLEMFVDAGIAGYSEANPGFQNPAPEQES